MRPSRSTLWAATWGQVAEQPLVDLHVLELEDVAQLVDPVVEVHGLRLRADSRLASDMP